MSFRAMGRALVVLSLSALASDAYVKLIGGCELFAGATRAACFRWLGKTLAVVTDGEFARAGCPQLEPPDARRFCDAGARRMDEALVTFS